MALTNGSLGLVARTQIREPYLSFELKPYEKLTFSPCWDSHEAQPHQSIPVGPTGLSICDSPWNGFLQGKPPCSSPQLGRGCHRVWMQLQSSGVNAFFAL